MEKKTIIVASLWILGAFGLSQLLRLGSNLVVTRLLEPEMFGIMAIVYVVIQRVTMLSDVGLWAFVVRHKNGTDSKLLNTVWTIQVVRGWIMFVVVILVAQSLSVISQLEILDPKNAYNSDTLPLLLIFAGTTAVISGYNTMAPAVMSRELKRGRLETIELVSQLISSGAMILLAWMYNSIWALVFAAVIGSILNVILTYLAFPVRHNFSWDKSVVKEVWGFGKWIVVASLLTFFALQGDKLLFATYISAEQLGVYSIAFMMTAVVATILQKIISKVWLPVLSKVANEQPAKLKDKYYKIRLTQDIAVFFLIGGLISISPDLIGFLYDTRYHEAGWMMQVLSFSVLGMMLSVVGLECLTALGVTKIRMKVMAIRSLFIFIGLPILLHYYGLQGGIWGVVLSSFVALPMQYIEMKKHDIFSLILEIRMIPMVGVGYLLSQLILEQI